MSYIILYFYGDVQEGLEENGVKGLKRENRRTPEAEKEETFLFKAQRTRWGKSRNGA